MTTENLWGSSLGITEVNTAIRISAGQSDLHFGKCSLAWWRISWPKAFDQWFTSKPALGLIRHENQSDQKHKRKERKVEFETVFFFLLSVWIRILSKMFVKLTVFGSLIFSYYLLYFLFQHCNLEAGSYTKDLLAINRDLSSIFILDNSPVAYRAYPGKCEMVQSD